MKRITLIWVILMSLTMQAQLEDSLLWKISGNGLEKDSYLFGTMHVSEKIAFHLDDVFYESLMKADFVALESDPNTWLEYLFDSREVYDNLNLNNSYGNNSFYNKPFEIKPPKQEELVFFLANENMILNGLLYRTNGARSEFQEDTFLDMFIYQGGAKFAKKVFSLEDIERSSNLVKKAQKEPYKEIADIWLQKKMKDENYYSLLTNAYRDRKIEFIDSLNVGLYKEKHLKNMLYIRNEEMTKNIDSIIKTGSLFSAIGAAHLAGDKGVINMLKEKGYDLTPLISKQTSIGKGIKSQIEDKRIKTVFRTETSSDGFFTAKVPNKLYELNIMNHVIYLCPDLKNGSYVVVSRISTIPYLKGKITNLVDIDKFLIEAIPGKILSRKNIVKQGVTGVDIVNKTKTGNYQRYQIFFTPLEIAIFKMAGKKEFVKDTSNEFFDSLEFNNIGGEVTTVSPAKDNFEVDVPGYHSFINSNNIGNRLLQAYDKEDDAYYFVKEVILNDTDYLEEDTFELERIHERFYKNLEFEYEKGIFETQNNQLSFISKTITNYDDRKYIHLKTVIKGGHYYLLGYFGNTEKVPSSFFNSFKIKDITYEKETFEIKKDTSLYFSVKTTRKPKHYSYDYEKKNRKDYEGYVKSSYYTNLANENINVTLDKFHDYKSFKHVDSLWKKQLLIAKKEFGDYYSNYYSSLPKANKKKENSLYVTNKKQGKDSNGFEYLSYILRDSVTTRGVKVKNVYNKGALYELTTLIDTKDKTSKFVDTFYDSFKPNDTVIGKPLFSSKTDAFITALKNKDSIALKGYDYIDYEKSDVKKLKKLIRNYKFEDNQLSIKTYLIRELGRFRTKDVNTYLDKLYKDSYENPYNQIAIFKSFAQDRSKESYKRLLRLLEADIPLTSSNYDISSMINYSFNDSLAVTKHLIPDILNYATIDEYKEPIYQILEGLLKNKVIKPKNYKKFKKQILTEARIELKRQLSKKIDNNNNSSYYSSDSYSSDDILNIYTKLLYPFHKDEKVADFLSKLKKTDNYYVKSSLVSLKLKNNQRVNKGMLEDLAKDLGSSAVLYKMLSKHGNIKHFPKKFATKERLYKSSLILRGAFNKTKDSIVYINSREFKIGKKEYDAYFFKHRKKDLSDSYDKKWKLDYIAFEKGNDTSISILKSHNYETN
ncbi:MAG: TraB/GumN family protein, partial [Flavobacteriaceae bacterium]